LIENLLYQIVKKETKHDWNNIDLIKLVSFFLIDYMIKISNWNPRWTLTNLIH
jgi:hypothetical protein